MTIDRAPFLLDVSRLIWRRWAGVRDTGVDRVCLAYLEHYRTKAQAVIQHRWARRILHYDASAKLFELLASPRDDFRFRFTALMARELLRKGDRGADRLYLNVGHTGLDRPAFRSWVETADVRPVYLVHDLIPITHPEFCRPGEEERHRRRMCTMLATATGIIANSVATLTSLGDFAAEVEAKVVPQLVAPLGTATLYHPTCRPGTAELANFLMLGTIEGRKNHLFLLQLWSSLVDRLGAAAPQLTIVGQRGWEAAQAIAWLDRNKRLRGHVVEINDCSDERLWALLSTARALLFPSLAEGYGLPLVEALAAGVPVIASDLPIFRDVGQGIPTLLDPIDGKAWEQEILDYAQPDSDNRAAQLDRLRLFKPPTWQGHFNSVDAWLQTI